jgi:hypothetical protein
MQYGGGVTCADEKSLSVCWSLWSLMSTLRTRPIIVNDRPRPSARYIGELTRELARLARTDGCETLSYLLELAAIEAELLGGLPEGQSLS